MVEFNVLKITVQDIYVREKASKYGPGENPGQQNIFQCTDGSIISK